MNRFLRYRAKSRSLYNLEPQITPVKRKGSLAKDSRIAEMTETGKAGWSSLVALGAVALTASIEQLSTQRDINAPYDAFDYQSVVSFHDHGRQDGGPFKARRKYSDIIMNNKIFYASEALFVGTLYHTYLTKLQEEA